MITSPAKRHQASDEEPITVRLRALESTIERLQAAVDAQGAAE